MRKGILLIFIIIPFTSCIHLGSKYFFEKGIAEDVKKNYRSAELDYTYALNLNPHNGEAYNRRGIDRDNLGKHSEAIDDYTKALGLIPHSATIYLNRGMAKEANKEGEDAILGFDTAISINPQKKEAYDERGRMEAYFGYKKSDTNLYSLAMDDFNFAIFLDDRYALAYKDRGIIKA